MEMFTADDYFQYLEDIDALGHEVSDWEANFLESMLKERPQRLSEKQKAIIVRMAKKYLGEDID